jgi:dihydrofolate reductase
MRKLTFGCATSLDNYIAGPGGAIDWILWSNESSAAMAAQWKAVDTVLWGRKTFEFALRHGQNQGYPGKKNLVFSRTLGSLDGPVTLVTEDAVEYIRSLKNQGGKEIHLMGGGELARSLFEAGLIDQIRCNIHPLLLGSGVPHFHPMRRPIQLERIECRPFESGCISITYKVLAGK